MGDIFGTGPQVQQVGIPSHLSISSASSLNADSIIIQGADILAYGSEESHQYQVFVPDFLRGQYADHSWFPPDTAEKGQALGAYFQGPANPAKALGEIPSVIKEATSKSNGTITKWAGLGLCWGGKIVTLNSGSSSPFAAVVSAHPAMVDPADAENISIPFALLASKDEDAAAVKGFADGLKVPKLIETFGDMPHGWMAARGDLSDAKVKEEFKRGYETTLEFL